MAGTSFCMQQFPAQMTNYPVVRHQLDQRRARDMRFPASLLAHLLCRGARASLLCSGFIKMNLVGKESPRCLTLSADRAMKGVERPGSLSPFLCGADGAAGEAVMEIGIGGFECTA